ncbi:hypothetical protein DXG03_002292 [Asterophora parasitica]|uniref:Poly(A)+ RNA export protein n=1 Tax=Asterophora parasitica TaxID=117018 RepID=A0A9P7K8S0_9AGAR|nr:hypothetical protein DXG03_002292 [Asterophora parasitica]
MSFLGHANPTPATPNDSAFTTADKDVEVADLPTDSISSIDFAPQADFLAVGSWDNSVRVYEIGEGGQSQGKAIHQHAGPVLSVCWSRDGKVFSGSVDNTAAMLDVSTGQAMQVAQHDAPVKAVKWVDTPSGAVLATGSWDKTVKYWDMRSPTPVITVNLPERCYAFDAQFPFVVAGSADRQIQVFNLANPQTPYKTLTSPLHGLTRVISCFTATSTHGFAIGSVEGRVGIQYIEDRDTQ